jgi:hypothetical protein
VLSSGMAVCHLHPHWYLAARAQYAPSALFLEIRIFIAVGFAFGIVNF